MKRSYILLVALLAIGHLHALSQADPCGTPDPGIASPSDIAFALRAQAMTNKVTATVKVIPIAFHVIRSFDGFPPDPTNISDAQIASQMQVLNDDFRGRSTGIDTEDNQASPSCTKMP